MSYNGQSNLPYGYAGLDINGLIINPILPTGQDASKIANGSVNNTTYQYLSGVTSPLQAQIDAINAGYVAIKAAAMAAGNVVIALPATSTFDTYSATIGDIIFLAQQADPTENGLYVFNGPTVAMTRDPQYNTWIEIVGSRIFVDVYGSGSAQYSGTVWQSLAQTGGVIGTDPIVYQQIQQNYIAGTGVHITGNSISIGQAVETSSNVQFGLVQATSGVVTQGQMALIRGSYANSLTSASLTANHTFTLPDADSNSVAPISAVSNKFVINIDSNGVQHLDFASIAGLSDVTLTSLAANQFLQYNGSAWVNVDTNATVIGEALNLGLTNIAAVGSSDSINLAIGKLASAAQRASQIVTADYTMLITDDNVRIDTASAITMFDPATSVIGLEYLVYNNTASASSVIANIAGSVVTQALAPFTSLKLRVAGSYFLPA